MTRLTEDHTARLRATLEARRAELQAEVQDGNERRAGEDQYAELASEVPDAGDASVASEQSDLRSAQIDRDVGEWRAVERALVRLDDGSYGACAECGDDIPVARLEAMPMAELCVPCQSRLESRTGAPTGSSL